MLNCCFFVSTRSKNTNISDNLHPKLCSFVSTGRGLSLSRPGPTGTAQASFLRSPGLKIPSLSRGFQAEPSRHITIYVQDLATHGRVYRIKKDDDSDIRTDDLDYDNFRIAPVLYVPVLSITITTFRRLHQHFQPTSLHWIGIEIPDYLTLVTPSRLSVGYGDRVRVASLHFSVLYRYSFLSSFGFDFDCIPIAIFCSFCFCFDCFFFTDIFSGGEDATIREGGTWSSGLRPLLHHHMLSHDLT